ncbi:MAG: inositol monophosphatase [Flavobacteriales bacterium]|nr:inositol monophosphatase [Flavobacteriales bacterium]
MVDLKSLCEKVCIVSKEVGDYIRTERKNISIDVETKSLNSFVTHVDKEAEKQIVEQLSVLFPEAGYIAEEGTSNKKGETYNWIIDPLDGTTNFIHSIPCFSVSIGLMKNGVMILGVVYEINFDECFYAYESSPAFLNGKEITVSKTTKLEDSLIATGFPYYDYGKLSPYLELLGHFTKNTRGIRRLGSAATDLAYVACGRFESFYEYGLSPWDVAAGAFIVQQAGGSVSDFNNDKNYIFGKQILATNKLTHENMLKEIQHFFDKS